MQVPLRGTSVTRQALDAVMSWHCSGEKRWIYLHILVLTITFAVLGLVQLVHFGGKHVMMYIVGAFSY